MWSYSQVKNNIYSSSYLYANKVYYTAERKIKINRYVFYIFFMQLSFVYLVNAIDAFEVVDISYMIYWWMETQGVFSAYKVNVFIKRSQKIPRFKGAHDNQDITHCQWYCFNRDSTALRAWVHWTAHGSCFWHSNESNE